MSDEFDIELKVVLLIPIIVILMNMMPMMMVIQTNLANLTTIEKQDVFTEYCKNHDFDTSQMNCSMGDNYFGCVRNGVKFCFPKSIAINDTD